MDPQPKQTRIQLAFETYKKGIFSSITTAAVAFDVAPFNTKKHLKGAAL